MQPELCISFHKFNTHPWPSVQVLVIRLLLHWTLQPQHEWKVKVFLLLNTACIARLNFWIQYGFVPIVQTELEYWLVLMDLLQFYFVVASHILWLRYDMQKALRLLTRTCVIITNTQVYYYCFVYCVHISTTCQQNFQFVRHEFWFGWWIFEWCGLGCHGLIVFCLVGCMQVFPWPLLRTLANRDLMH